MIFFLKEIAKKFELLLMYVDYSVIIYSLQLIELFYILIGN